MAARQGQRHVPADRRDLRHRDEIDPTAGLRLRSWRITPDGAGAPDAGRHDRGHDPRRPHAHRVHHRGDHPRARRHHRDRDAIGRGRLPRSAGLPRAGRPRPLRDRGHRLGGEPDHRLVGRSPAGRRLRRGTLPMQALVKTTAGPGLELCDVPEPAMAINDVRIRVHKTGICGTDLHIADWDAWAATHDPAAAHRRPRVRRRGARGRQQRR